MPLSSMQFKLPKNDAKYRWTRHVVRKMMHYGLSADRIKRIIRAPARMEEGIAPGTLAAMQKTGSKKKPSEIWVMYATRNQNAKMKPVRMDRRPGGDQNDNLKSRNQSKMIDDKLKIHNDNFGDQKIIITAWRYPGVSPVRDQIPIPADILAELKDVLEWERQ